jgi:hypothetical protein
MAIKTFATGEVLTASDTNTYLANAGLVYVTSTTVGTAVSSVTVSNCFSSTYDNYRIIMNYVVASTNSAGILLTLGTTATGYYQAGAYYAYDASGDGTTKRNNGADWNIGYFGANQTSAVFDLLYPNVTNRTAFSAQSSGDLYFTTVSGWLGDNTAYTSFKIAPSAGTITGGKITVYGYRKA